jgi:acetate kinase
MTVNDVRNELYRKSGLLGLSGLSADMRELLASTRPEAFEAVEIFCDRVAREVASLATALDGFDALVFTAGIGEHSPEIRARILKRLAWLGLKIDDEANAGAGHHQCITKPTSKRAAWVLATDEEGEMLREGLGLLEPG